MYKITNISLGVLVIYLGDMVRLMPGESLIVNDIPHSLLNLLDPNKLALKLEKIGGR